MEVVYTKLVSYLATLNQTQAKLLANKIKYIKIHAGKERRNNFSKNVVFIYHTQLGYSF